MNERRKGVCTVTNVMDVMAQVQELFRSFIGKTEYKKWAGEDAIQISHENVIKDKKVMCEITVFYDGVVNDYAINAQENSLCVLGGQMYGTDEENLLKELEKQLYRYNFKRREVVQQSLW